MDPTVYIGFCKGTGWLSRLIETADAGPSHVFLLYYDSNWKNWIQLGEEAGGLLPVPAYSDGSVSDLFELPSLNLLGWNAKELQSAWFALRLPRASRYDVG